MYIHGLNSTLNSFSKDTPPPAPYRGKNVSIKREADVAKFAEERLGFRTAVLRNLEVLENEKKTGTLGRFAFNPIPHCRA